MQTFTRLDATASIFERDFQAFLGANREVSQDVDDAVAAIVFGAIGDVSSAENL